MAIKELKGCYGFFAPNNAKMKTYVKQSHKGSLRVWGGVITAGRMVAGRSEQQAVISDPITLG